MSHSIGRMVSITPIVLGPGGVLSHGFVPQNALTGGKPRFVILHFTSMTFSGGAQLKVNVGYGGPGYDVDIFTTNGDGWTRPIDPTPGPIQINWVGGSGSATLAEYASGEPITTGVPGTDTGRTTNPDVFLEGLDSSGKYIEPVYETRAKCGGAFDWKNMVCTPLTAAEEAAGKAVCMIVAREEAEGLVVSTCTGTLIGPDLVISAEHCCADADDLTARSGSVTFDFQTNCDLTKAASYNPVFHKIKRIVRQGTGIDPSPPVSVDWAILQIETPPGGLGIAPRVIRSTAAMANESIFAIHHPNASVKKIQRSTFPSGSQVSGFTTDLDVAGGSSGSALFDVNGNIIGAAAHTAGHCSISYCPNTDLLAQLANPPAPPAPFDVMMVMDRSGSMGEPGTSMPGKTKMDEAHEASKLFVSLVRNNQGDKLGMVSFSNSANRPPDAALGAVNAGHKTQLNTAIDNLHPDARTSIGDGLKAAMESLTPGANQRGILLMTDGLQNEGVTIPQGEAAMSSDTRLFIVGFGAEGDMDGPGMTSLARRHNGIFNRANDGLRLKKFFSLCFGNIFEAGTLVDPDRVLGANERVSKAVPFSVCEEERITAVVGWHDPSQTLRLLLRTPGGVNVAGVESAAGNTWHFLRVPLPHNGERAGTWQWQVERIIGGGEFPPQQVDVRYFVHIVAAGGPRLMPVPLPPRRIYTGDPVNPLVALKFPNGTPAPNGKVKVEIEAPNAAIGQLMSQAHLDPPRTEGDPVDAFHATLQRIERERGPLPTRTVTADLFDDGDHEDGAWEPDGVFGSVLRDLTRFEGTYNFHARAAFGEGCISTREALWSMTVEPSIDPGRTTFEPTGNGLKITPADVYGNPLGPGRGDGFTVAGTRGVTVTGPPVDNGDGSYTVPATWDPGVTPGVVVGQPERPPVVVGPKPTPQKDHCRKWKLLVWLLMLLVLLLLLLLLLK